MASQGLSARILANLGQDQDAEQLVRSAAALAPQAGLLSTCVDPLLELSHARAAAGRVSEAHSAATQVLGHYQRKDIMAGARESLRYLNQFASA